MKLKGKGHCSYCDTPNVRTTPCPDWKDPRDNEVPDMCDVCFQLGAGYPKDALNPVRFDQMSRAVRLILGALLKGTKE